MGKGIRKREDGLYQARFTNRFGKRQEFIHSEIRNCVVGLLFFVTNTTSLNSSKCSFPLLIISPFFMNAGAYVTGSQLRRLGQYYAKAILRLEQ